MERLALTDLIRPYFFLGVDLGDEVGRILSWLHVDEYEEAWDDDGVALSGIARIADDAAQPLGFSFSGGDNDLEFDPHDIAVHFRLSVARRAAASLVSDDLNDEVKKAVKAFGPSDTAPSDYPGTQFRLELLFNLVTITFPGLVGAKPDGAFLTPDPDHREVKFDLPRIVLQIDQDSAADTAADADIASWGAEGLNDLDESVAAMFRMRPSYALFDGNKFGFALDKAVLDLSERSTPPDLLERFGLGDDFTGLHLPELRFFFSEAESVGFAGNVGARDLVIGFKPEPAIWGDLSFDLELRGDELDCGLRLYNAASTPVDVESVDPLPTDPAELERFRAETTWSMSSESENFLLMVDIASGGAPYQVTVVHALDHGAIDGETADLDAFIADQEPSKREDISPLRRKRLFSPDQQVLVKVEDRDDRVRYMVLDLQPVAEQAPAPPPSDEDDMPAVRLEPPSEDVHIVGRPDVDHVDIAVSANGAEDIRINGEPATNGRATVPLTGERTSLTAEWTNGPDSELVRATASFDHDVPQEGTAFSLSDGDVAGLGEFVRRWQAEAAAGAPPAIRIDGYASTVGEANIEYNLALSMRRAKALRNRLAQALPEARFASLNNWGENGYPEASSGADPRLVQGHTVSGGSAQDATDPSSDHYNPGYEQADYRIAVASFVTPAPSTGEYTGNLVREEEEPEEEPPGPDADPPQSNQPDWLRSIGATIRWERKPVPVAAEIRGVVDFQTAHEDALKAYQDDLGVVGPDPEVPDEGNLPEPDSEPNPDDGVVEFRIAITHDPSTGTFTETLVARAGADDRDGLWSWGEIPAEDTDTPPSDAWRDLAGLYFALAPLTASAAADAANGGEVVPLVVSLATPIAVTALGVAHVLRLTHYGIELGITHDEDEVHSVLLFDVESAIWVNLALDDFVIVTTRADKPIKVRYKAIGFSLDVGPDRDPQFLPVFDSSRGYTLDLADSGSLRVLPSLGEAIGEIIQVLGARIARTNPLNLEVDLGLGVDLGVIKVDKFGFRLPVEPLGPPTITAIGASVDIPNTLVGKGYLEIFKDGFSGKLDLTLPAVDLRVAAGLAIRTVYEGLESGREPEVGPDDPTPDSATGVLATIEVEFPGGIPLGGSGLAIFGLLGLFAMHHARTEDESVDNPALHWLDTKVDGNPADPKGWKGELGAWAFGLGVVAGTIEGGTILNVKGMLVVELPGPRVLLFVKAQLLSEKPPTDGATTGNLLAVVDVGPAGVRIGVKIEYEIEEVLHLEIPVQALFPSPDIENFAIDIGTIAKPIKATILELFKATAYLMVHGNGIPQFPLFEDGLQGFSLATGFHVSITWGEPEINLYLKVAAGFDAGIGFAPLTFGGRLYLEGALHLFIVAIEASAALTVKAAEVEAEEGKPETKSLVTYIHGEVCGKINLLFFTLEACVGFELGTDPDTPPAPALIRDLILQSRSPALVEGTAVDRGVDTVLCRATTDETVPTVGKDEDRREVYVPIDAIPLLQFEVAPIMDADAVDGTLQGAPRLLEDGWQKRGTTYVRYHVNEIELKLVAQHGEPVPDGTSPTTAGPRPYTWRNGPDSGGDSLPTDLAMLDWKPTNTDKAVIEGVTLDGIVEDRWGEACTPVARPASVLWTFLDCPLGPDGDGWELQGEAWPDESGTRRSRPVETAVLVRETWRTDSILDGLLPHKNAEVVGSTVKCPEQKPLKRPGKYLDLRPKPPKGLQGGIGEKGLHVIGEKGSQVIGEKGRHVIGEKGMCVSRALEAPYELLASSLSPEVYDSELGGALREVGDALEDGLRDVVRVSGGPHEELTLLVVAHMKLVDAGLMSARAYDADGRDLGEADVDFRIVENDRDLPKRWTDEDGPWRDEVRLARLHTRGGWGPMGEFLVRIKPKRPAFHIDLGIRPLTDAIEQFDLTAPSWFLLAFEGLSTRELRRAEDDENENGRNEDALEDSLRETEHALLLPDAEYRVTVHYTAETGRKPEPDEEGDPNRIIREWNSEIVIKDPRTFFTDAKAPRNLEPWMLTQFPAPDEPHHFHNDPVVFLFATDDVLELYGAYDRTLRAVARAASFRGSAGTPEAPFTHIALAGLFEAVEGLVLSPFEATVRRSLGDRPCRDFDPVSNRHGRTVVDFHLDPLTDYVVDIEALDPDGEVDRPAEPGDNETGIRPLYRRRMTTSRYGSRNELAEAVRISRVVYRLITDPAPLLGLDDVAGDDEFDRALRDAGLEARPRPDRPHVTVLWNSGGEAVAIYIETPEPLWRSREEPRPVYAADGVHILQWRLERTEWLLVDELVPTTSVPVSEGGAFTRPGYTEQATPALTVTEERDRVLRPGEHEPAPKPPPPPNALVERFVRDGSGARTLVFLESGARGSTVTLGLARNLHPLLDSDSFDIAALLGEITLHTPAWETP